MSEPRPMSLSRKVAPYLLVLLLVVIGVAQSACGFDIRSLIKVPTPREIQQDHGLPGKLPLPEAEDEYRGWLETTKRVGGKWKTSIEGGRNQSAIIEGLWLGGRDTALAYLGGAFPGLVGLGALLLKRPGDWTPDDVRKGKEASYKAGQKSLADLLAKAGIKAPADLPPPPTA